jgi:uncharacterized surface protein with fasciclin (FAS1) repeats
MQFLVAFLTAVSADPSKTIVENAVATPSLSTLVKVLTTKGYEPVLQLLSGPGNFTVFAPNNDAFAQIRIDPANVAFVTAVLQYHVLGTHFSSKQLPPIAFVPTLLTNPTYVNIGKDKGQFLGVFKSPSGRVELSYGIPFRDNSRVVTADVESSNGVVHIIDRVLIFPNLTSVIARESGLRILVEAVVKANLVSAVDTTAGITILAPDDRAFEAVGGIGKFTPEQLAKILSYHVIPAEAFSTDLKDGEKLPTLISGAELTVHITATEILVRGATNEAAVREPNIFTKNAVIHVIDRVLLPPSY